MGLRLTLIESMIVLRLRIKVPVSLKGLRRRITIYDGVEASTNRTYDGVETETNRIYDRFEVETNRIYDVMEAKTNRIYDGLEAGTNII